MQPLDKGRERNGPGEGRAGTRGGVVRLRTVGSEAALQTVNAGRGRPLGAWMPPGAHLFGVFVRTPTLLLAAFEFLAAGWVASAAAASTGAGSFSLFALTTDPRALFLACVLSAAAIAMGLYSVGIQYRDARPWLRSGVAFLLAAPIALGAAALLLPLPALPLPMVALTLLGQLAVVQLDRRLASALFNDRLFQRRVLVLGAGREAARIGARLRRRSDRRGFELLAYVSLGEGTRIPGAESAPVLPIAQLDLPEFCREHGIEEIVVATDDRRGDGAQAPLPVDALLTCRTAGILVTELVRFLEREAGRVDLDVLRPSWLLFSPGFTLPLRMGLKRTVDVAASLVLLAVSWPVMIVTALAIRLEDGGSAPVLYRQTRVGLRGRRFRVLKFRSMCVDAERLGQPQWADREDPRITRTGGFIRALRIDELPQLFNVLRGDMSLVGPRPERPEFVDRFDREIPFYGARHSVKPGLTGWAQLNYPYGSSDEDARRKLEFDLYYVKNYSVALDLMIMIRTVEVVLFGRGAR